jgi:hypothetical protein
MMRRIEVLGHITAFCIIHNGEELRGYQKAKKAFG